MEDEILNKRKTLSNQRKELSKLQFYETFHQLNPSHPSTTQTTSIVTSHNPPSSLYVPPYSNSQFQSSSNGEKENYPSYYEGGYGQGNGNGKGNIGTRGIIDQQFDFNHSLFHSQQQQQQHNPMNTTTSSNSKKQNIDTSFIEQELYQAKKIMEVAKGEIKRSSTINKQSNSFLQNENLFLQKIQKKNYT